MSKLALKLIKECYETKNPYLDLGNCGLRDEDFIEDNPIHLALRKCKHLETLVLSNTWEDITGSGEIRSANNDSANHLTILPVVLTYLSSLLELVSAGERETPWGIRDITPISGLSNLRRLNLSYNKIKIIKGLEMLISLKHLDLKNNQIKVIRGLENLTDLRVLSLSYNKITEIKGLGSLSALQELFLNGNQVTEMKGLETLSDLFGLHLDSNQIKEIKGIHNLSALRVLFISYNQITEIKGLDALTDLQVLAMSSNLIMKIKGLNTLTALSALFLTDNKITSIQGLEALTALKVLYLSNNQILEICGLDTLKALKKLSLYKNGITEIKGLDSLNDLEELDLSSNRITEIKGLDSLATLWSLDFDSNQIQDIFPLLKFLQRNQKSLKILVKDTLSTKKGSVRVSNNPLTTPPTEIVQQGTEAIINYFNELEKQGVDYLYEAKLLIVGQPRAGKTSLRCKLFDSKAKLPDEDKTTRGIDIERIHFDTKDKEGISRQFHYNVWDFGGQQIYQTTHQFFLTHRSLYVLVIDTGKDSIGNDDATINYWLQAVELLGGNSPLLLVLNEKNGRTIPLDLLQKKARFGFLKGEYKVDLNALNPDASTYNSKRKSDFDQLKQDIETALSRLPLIGFPMPRTWVKIREELQARSATNAFISLEKYKEICSSFGVPEYERQLELSRIFHDLGIFLHFQDYGILDDFIVLQNTWATDAVFAILDNETVKLNLGRFTDNDLAGIWEGKGYPKEVHKKLLGLMMQFELCYRVNKVKPYRYIVPEMLPDSAPDNYSWQPNEDLPLQYRYDFMPKGLLTRLIVRLNQNIYTGNNQQLVWKTGVMIDGNQMDCLNTYAEITEAWDNRQLAIRIQGKFSKDLMSKITQEIDELNKDYFKQIGENGQTQKSRWYKMIPCNCISCNESNEKFFYDYNELLERKEYGKDTIECKRKPFTAINIDELLGGVFSKESKPKQTEKNITMSLRKKIFISYAHKDERWKDKLVDNLSALRNQDLIADWNDRKIEAGLWDPQIEAAMEDADIFLLLITKNFLSSAYITSKEITKAYSLFKLGKTKIVPVICDSCAWELQPITKDEKEFHPVENKEIYIWLGKFQPFPKDGKPIKKWANQQDGFVDVINQLKKYL